MSRSPWTTMIERTSRKGAVEAAASDGDNAKVEQDHSSDLSRLDAAYLDLKSRIMTGANHDVLKELLDALHFPLIRYRFRIAFIPGRKKKSIAEHRKIYECLIKRDAAAAERAMRKHIAEVRTDLARAKDVMSL